MPETTAPKPETTAPKPETTAPKPETTAPKPETTAPKPETTAPKPETETTGPFDDTYYPDEIYTYENALPEREHVPDGFFSDAIFVGDSRLAGIMLYSKPKVAGDFAVVSLNVSTVFTRKAIDMGDGKKITVADAIRRTEFNKCYIMFGINELSWPSPAGFIKNYKKVINLIREVNPDVEIYILNVFPVTVKYWEKHPKMGNDRVQNLDRLIAKMAWEENLKLVNVAGALSDEYGNLPASCSSDGVHGNRSTCRKLFDYMCTHW